MRDEDWSTNPFARQMKCQSARSLLEEQHHSKVVRPRCAAADEVDFIPYVSQLFDGLDGRELHELPKVFRHRIAANKFATRSPNDSNPYSTMLLLETRTTRFRHFLVVAVADGPPI